MAIKKIKIENFKGIKKLEMDLKPINILVGPNSGGKSSILHALVVLKQTLALPNQDRALILDDEQALVHLGRYVDVVHNHNYKSQIGLGFEFDYNFGRRHSISAYWKFRGTKRTQDIYISSATIETKKSLYKIKEKSGHKDRYIGEFNEKNEIEMFRDKNFIFYPLIVRDDKQSFNSWVPFMMSSRAIPDELNRLHYLGPFRDPPRRRYQTRGTIPSDVGVSGELTIPLLVDEWIRKKKRPILMQVKKWLIDMGLSLNLTLDREGRSDIFRVELQSTSNFPVVTPADLGYGVSQVLPVLVQCAAAEKESTLLFEQPEIHLHPLVQEKLLDVFIESAKKKSLTILIETHSENLIISMLSAIRDRRLDVKDVNLISVRPESGESKITIHHPDEYGDVYENWRKGFSSEY